VEATIDPDYLSCEFHRGPSHRDGDGWRRRDKKGQGHTVTHRPTRAGHRQKAPAPVRTKRAGAYGDSPTNTGRAPAEAPSTNKEEKRKGTRWLTDQQWNLDLGEQWNLDTARWLTDQQWNLDLGEQWNLDMARWLTDQQWNLDPGEQWNLDTARWLTDRQWNLDLGEQWNLDTARWLTNRQWNLDPGEPTPP
jgi:hypothetical protein